MSSIINFFKKAFSDMKESAKKQHEVDKANLKAIQSKIDVVGGNNKTIYVGETAEFKIKITSPISISKPTLDIESDFKITEFRTTSNGLTNTYEYTVKLKKDASKVEGIHEIHLIHLNFGNGLEKKLTVNVIPPSFTPSEDDDIGFAPSGANKKAFLNQALSDVKTGAKTDAEIASDLKALIDLIPFAPSGANRKAFLNQALSDVKTGAKTDAEIDAALKALIDLIPEKDTEVDPNKLCKEQKFN